MTAGQAALRAPHTHTHYTFAWAAPAIRTRLWRAVCAQRRRACVYCALDSRARTSPSILPPLRASLHWHLSTTPTSMLTRVRCRFAIWRVHGDRQYQTLMGADPLISHLRIALHMRLLLTRHSLLPPHQERRGGLGVKGGRQRTTGCGTPRCLGAAALPPPFWPTTYLPAAPW